MTTTVVSEEGTQPGVGGSQDARCHQLDDPKGHMRDFPGDPVVKALCFQCRGDGFDPWLGN